MANTLELGESIYLKTPLSKGMVLAFKSRRLDLTPPKIESMDPTRLQLWNKAGEIVLQISIFCKRNEVSFNSRTLVSLLDGWGGRETIRNIATSFQSTSQFTISVHDCGDEYQILFNLTTVHFFQKRFSVNSRVTKVTYRQGSDYSATTLSPSLRVLLYDPDSLPTTEKIALRSGVTSSIDLLTSLKWNGGNEVRIYYLGSGNILHENAYSAGGKNKGWNKGDLHKLGIVLKANAALVVVRLELLDNIHIYYQDPKSGFIQTLCRTPQGHWTRGRKIVQAVNGSSIAAIVRDSNTIMDAVYVYYQGLDLHVRERVWSPDAGRWVSSGFDAGVQPQGTPIYASTKDGEIEVAWKDAKGRFTIAKRSTLLRLSASSTSEPGESKAFAQLDGRD